MSCGRPSAYPRLPRVLKREANAALAHSASDFSALICLPPGPHRLKFIVDKEWKASKHLPVATDADGNLINYLQVNANPSKAAATLLDWSSGSLVPLGSTPTSSGATIPLTAWGALDEDEEEKWEVDDSEWTQEIPPELVEWGEWETARETIEVAYQTAGGTGNAPNLPPPPASSGVAPPSLPAQLEKGPLNHAAYVTQGSGDDNSILPKPDHSVINHLAASPIKGGFLSVGVTTRYKRKVRLSVLVRATERVLTCSFGVAVRYDREFPEGDGVDDRSADLVSSLRSITRLSQVGISSSDAHAHSLLCHRLLSLLPLPKPPSARIFLSPSLLPFCGVYWLGLFVR